MRIRCDWETCNSFCKYFRSCHLHQPANKALLNARCQLNWNINRLSEINEGINHFHDMLFQYKQGLLPDFIAEHISINTIEHEIKKLRKEKKDILSEIKEYQIKENNISKILKRRQK